MKSDAVSRPANVEVFVFQRGAETMSTHQFYFSMVGVGDYLPADS